MADCIFYQGYEETCLRCNKTLDDHPPKDFPDLTEVVERLAQYDRRMAELNAEWAKAETDEQVYDLIKKEATALNGLRFAFWEATKDRNGFHHCQVAGDDYIRALCKSWVHRQRMNMPIGFVACWKDLPRGGHCRKPKDHEGICLGA